MKNDSLSPCRPAVEPLNVTKELFAQFTLTVLFNIVWKISLSNWNSASSNNFDMKVENSRVKLTLIEIRQTLAQFISISSQLKCPKKIQFQSLQFIQHQVFHIDALVHF